MKILDIKNNNNIYIVTIRPNWLKRMFGAKTYEERIMKRFGVRYWLGGGNVYNYSSGKLVDNCSKLYDALENNDYRF